MTRRRFPLVDVLVGTPSSGPRLGSAALLTHGLVLELFADAACTTPLDATDLEGVPISSVTIDGVSIPPFYGPDDDEVAVVYGRVAGDPAGFPMAPVDAAAVPSSYATAGAGPSQVLMATLEAESRDASVLVVGDSTGNTPDEWVYLTAEWIAAQYPRWTVHYRLWDDAAGAYAAATVVQAGTAGRVLTIYNASVAGASVPFWHGPRAAAAVYPLAPDLVFVSLGHNEQNLAADLWHSRYVGFVEELSLRLPSTPVVLIAQNPATANTNQQARRDVYRAIAAARGYGFVDVCKAFEDAGGDLTADGVHPTPAGSALWRDVVVSTLRFHRGATPHPIAPSTLTRPGVNLLKNHDLASFSPGSLPAEWGGSNVDTARDTVNYESSTLNRASLSGGYSSTAVKLTGTGAGQAQLWQYVPVHTLRGLWVTAAVRLYVPAGQSGNVGRVALTDSGGSTLHVADSTQHGGFRWVTVSRYVPPTATNIRLLIYVDSSGGTGTMTLDRASLVVGKYPAAA